MILDVDYPRGQSTSFLLHISLSRPSDGNADRQKWRSEEPV